jgi:hypothetical protein
MKRNTWWRHERKNRNGGSYDVEEEWEEEEGGRYSYQLFLLNVIYLTQLYLT